MLEFLIAVLTPLFTPLGVSPIDVQTYVYNLSGYIYLLLAVTAMLLAVLIAVH